ncbi:hypothetical protein ACFQ71_03005 [Streptomyces sp. NPDC056534]|uniref:hypothetical protein n=1 Tax=Streptomyces sp. NPDC056534 TaxID=3345857 RepID=UPI0036CE4529
MAEVSYPFAQANASGGSAILSQDQWQKMARMWGGDRVDFRLTSTTYDDASLPFSSRVINNRQIEIQPGRAWVGGFFYELTSSFVVNIESNPLDKIRKDTVVLRADFTKGSVNLAVVKGQPSASPIPPQPVRTIGGLWDMTLIEVNVPAKDGAITLSTRQQFDMPPSVGTPWNTRSTADYVQNGTFLYDLDVNNTDGQHEAFKGRDGYVTTRHFGKSLDYTPNLLGVSSQNIPGQYREGRWRYTAPGMAFFSAKIHNSLSTAITRKQGEWRLGITLPTPAHGGTGQTLYGYVVNPGLHGLPNYFSVTGVVMEGAASSNLYFMIPSLTTLREGLDGMWTLPSKATLYISGTYETNAFGE